MDNEKHFVTFNLYLKTYFAQCVYLTFHQLRTLYDVK